MTPAFIDTVGCPLDADCSHTPPGFVGSRVFSMLYCGPRVAEIKARAPRYAA